MAANRLSALPEREPFLSWLDQPLVRRGQYVAQSTIQLATGEVLEMKLTGQRTLDVRRAAQAADGKLTSADVSTHCITASWNWRSHR
jgi:hypothetical protein